MQAGVPDTYSFVKQFRASIHDQNKKTTVDRIIATLEQWKGSEIDVELLLETLTKLDAKGKEPLLRFFKDIDGKFILSGYSEKRPIIEDLKDFIKAKAIIKAEEQIKYLEPLLGFVEECRPLDIISVNYDTCVEQFCNVYKLNYQDGFDLHWNPKVFEAESTDIRLYKLHGSVIWYRSDRAGYIKLPVMVQESSIQLITGEKAESLMLYPMQKWDYAEPLLELLVEMKRRIEAESCKFLIVVGYSFRDDHILRILWDAARKNRNLNLVIIDPKAYQIYSEKLKHYDSKSRVPSSLDGRVVCLPYKFEAVFPLVKDHYLKNFRDGLACVADQRQSELKGRKADWRTCLKPFVDAEHVEKAEETLEKIDPSEIEGNWQLSLELPLKIGLSLAASGQRDKAESYLRRFGSRLRIILVERLNVEVISSVIRINFNYVPTDSGSHFVDGAKMKNFIESLYQYAETRSEMIATRSDQVDEITEKLDRIRSYLTPIEEQGINIDRYIQVREERIRDIECLKDIESFEKQFQEDSLERRRELANRLVEIERKIIREIIEKCLHLA